MNSNELAAEMRRLMSQGMSYKQAAEHLVTTRPEEFRQRHNSNVSMKEPSPVVPFRQPDHPTRGPRPGPWYRWVPEMSKWVYVPASQEELNGLRGNGPMPAEEMSKAEAGRRIRDASYKSGNDDAA